MKKCFLISVCIIVFGFEVLSDPPTVGSDGSIIIRLISIDENQGLIKSGNESTTFSGSWIDYTGNYLRDFKTALLDIDGNKAVFSAQIAGLMTNSVTVTEGCEFIGWAFDRSSLGHISSARSAVCLQKQSFVDDTTKYDGHKYFISKESFVAIDDFWSINSWSDTTLQWATNGFGMLVVDYDLNFPSGLSSIGDGTIITDTYYAVFAKILGPPTATITSAAQRYPWANKIDVSYTGANLTSASYALRFKLTHGSTEKLIDTGTTVTPVDGAVSGTYTIDLETQATEFLNLSKTTFGLVVDLLPNE